MTDKELIKQEIERRIESINSCPFRTAELGSEKIEERELSAYNSILQFIDSLPEESGCEVNFTTKSEDFESEWKRYIDSKGGGAVTINVKDIARHFAEWQKNQMKEVLQTEYEKGRFDMREELMEDAVECNWGSQATSAFMSDFLNIDIGDKVKVIILKTE